MSESIESILRRAALTTDERERVYRAYRSRDAALNAEVTWRTKMCPGCGSGLKVKSAPPAATLFVCADCSFWHKVNFVLDESRPMEESYTAGVTGKRTPTVIFSADGREIRRIDL